jgi:hypothetical protein
MEELLSLARKNNIFLRLVDGKLSVRFPKGNVDKDVLARLQQRKDELVNYLDRKKKHEIPVVPNADGYALSSSQQRIWTQSQLENVNVAYHIPAVFVLEGNLDRPALEAAFNALIHRHEILRTVFGEDEEGNAKQYVLNKMPFEVSFKTVTGQQLNAFVQADFEKPFDLEHGPLLRASLYQLSADKCVLVYVMHHIISDGWSMGVVVKELLLLYKGAALEPLRIQYKDYAAWQRGQLNDRAKNYWLQQLSGTLPVLELPLDKPRPAVKTYNGGIVRKKFPPALVESLKAFNQQQGSTLFMSLLAALNALLHKYTGQRDIVIGSPIAGREHAELGNQIGFYINTLALRTRFDSSDSFRKLLEAVKAVALGAYDHQVYPFDALAEDMAVQRDVSRSLLFDVMLVLQNTDAASEVKNVAGIKLSRYEGLQRIASQFDLSFDFAEIDGQLQASIEYNSDLFYPETIELMAGHLAQLIEIVVADPGIELSKIKLKTNRPVAAEALIDDLEL